MKIILNPHRRPAGFVLLLVIVLAAFSVMILAGVMNRTSTVSLLNLRSTQLNQLDSAAEANVEKAYAKMAWDFQNGGGPGTVTNNLSSYQSLVPNTSDNAYWGNYVFSDPMTGNTNAVYVGFVGSYTGPLPAQFTNQFAYNSPIYRIASNVRLANSLVDVTGTAQEDVLLALVPITTYAIFYNGELEFSDCATMVVNGRVHSNSNIDVGAGSGATLTFNAKVTAVGTMSAPARGGVSLWTVNDPSTWLTTFNAGYTTNNPVVNIAISMTNTHSIIDIPPPTTVEPVMSQQGQVRLYNEAQIVLVVTNSPLGGAPRVLLTFQNAYNGNLPGADTSKTLFDYTNSTEKFLRTNVTTTGVSPAQIGMPFLSLTNTFVDQRQSTKGQYVTQIDVNQLNSWMTTNSAVTSKFSGGYNPTILYVADRRNLNTTTQAVVRLVNGAKLPYNNGLGFTVATQNPLYVVGNYNVTINSNTYALLPGSTTNGSSVPAAVLSDALTILSPSWQDSQSALAYTARNASSMTFNAAIVTGNMPSTGTSATTFSGGVHNLTRFLEQWDSSVDTLTLNTSIVCLFSSQMATAQFKMPGAYYDPPKRLWGFDETYYSPNKQPPGIPCALVPIRYNWFKPPPGTVAGN